MVRFVGKIQLSLLSILLFSLNGFAGGSIAGKISIVKGKVLIVRGSEKFEAKKDTTVLESDVIEAQVGGTARIVMIDSNLVDVYPKSKVEIAKYIYKPNDDKKEVELKVDFGKIKSTVNQKYDGAKNKFQVKTPSAVAGVRGTVFTAEYDSAKKISKVVTIEGLVAVTKILDRDKQSAPVFVRPNQSVKVDPEQSKIEQPRDLKSDEREQRRKEDKELGYQYDPKNEPTPGSNNNGNNNEPPKNAANPPPAPPPQTQPGTSEPPKDNGEPPKEVNRPPKTDNGGQANNNGSTDRHANPDAPSERPATANREVAKDVAKEKQQDQQERKQTASDDSQAKRQKQLEDEQARKQKQADDEQAKKAKAIEEMLATKRQQAENAQAKREEEVKKRTEDEAARRAEEARRLADIAKRAENVVRLPSGTAGGTAPNIEIPRITTPKQ